MRYNIGDKVRVRKDLKIDQHYCMENGKEDKFLDEMAQFRGKIVTIGGVFFGKYLIKEDHSNWFWTDEMFEDNSRAKRILIHIIGLAVVLGVTIALSYLLGKLWR